MGAQAVRLSNVDIDKALKNKDFEVLFQPVFDLGNGALARVETFVRWRHPKLGLLPPGAFISFFESQGRMGELTRYVLGSALNAYMDWRGPWPPGLSVNLALSDLSDEAFTSHFTKLLRDYDFPADLITLECPMPPVDMPADIAAAHFDRLSKTGARLAIEVRGRANDLLRSLDPFPFDEIKTGGSAILRFARTVRGPGLSAIADLLDVANKSNAAITAVGVEDQASLSALRGLGFTAAQGNHLAKVGELADFRAQRINEVRALLGLDPLSATDLNALFRTDALNSQTVDKVSPAASGENAEDALIERLKERVAQFEPPLVEDGEDDELGAFIEAEIVDNGDGAEAAPETPDAAAADAEADDARKARAREKAKALALAKRAKARAARKTAAIERAKAKAATKPDSGQADASGEPPSTAAPREMQERLSKAFTGEPTPAPAPDQAMPDEAAPDLFESAQAEAATPDAPENSAADQQPHGQEDQKTPEPATLSQETPEQDAREELETRESETQELTRAPEPAEAGTPLIITRNEIAQSPASDRPAARAAGGSTIERAMAAQQARSATPPAVTATPSRCAWATRSSRRSASPRVPAAEPRHPISTVPASTGSGPTGSG